MTRTLSIVLVITAITDILLAKVHCLEDNLPLQNSTSPQLSRAYVAMGCFWGVEGLFARLPGVLKTRVGYAGGTPDSPIPSYHFMGNHAETGELHFDETQTSYQDIANWLFAHHDPTAMPEGNDQRYRTLLFYTDEEQCAVAEETTRREKAKRPGMEMYFRTGIQPFAAFYPAEDYHQKHWLRLQPMLAQQLGLTSDAEMVESTVVAKVNAFLSGYNNLTALNLLAYEQGIDMTAVVEIAEIMRQGGNPYAPNYSAFETNG